MTTSDREVVAALGEVIAQRIGEPRYNLWFANKTKFTLRDDHLLVGVTNHFAQEWLQEKFADEVAAAVNSAVGRALEVRFVIDAQLFQAARRDQAQVADRVQRSPDSEERNAPPSPNSCLRTPASPSRSTTHYPLSTTKATRHWKLLADFVVGPCNRIAHAAALSVVEAPLQAANPLVLHGPVGTGKTHLLEGIYAGLRKHHPDRRICFITSEEFTNRFVQAMRGGKLGAFRKNFRECDALLVDDVHFLATKKATQEEFLHTFDVLHAHTKQLIVSCDCHPKLAGEFSPELTDRFLGGAIWGLEPPDQATRLGILRAKSARLSPPVPDEVLSQLAQALRGNVRELEGALLSVLHYGRVTGRSIDLAMAREAIADRLRHATRITRLEDIDRAVCGVLHLDKGTLQSRQRTWAVSHARMLAMFLARKHTAAAYSEIGNYFGGLNHSTAVAAEKKIRGWLVRNEELVLGQRRPPVKEVVELVERELFR